MTTAETTRFCAVMWGYHEESISIRGLLRIEKFVEMLARAATLCVRHKSVTCFCVCTAGKHRSVAACCCLEYMIEHYLSAAAALKVEHLESSTWHGSTCGHSTTTERCT